MEEIRLYVKDNYSCLPEALEGEEEVFLVYDRNVARFADEVAATVTLKGRMSIDATESTKTMDTVVAICRFLLEGGADRGALVLALGGGVTTDMAGFAASIFKRGIRFATLPTTLLSQVDAGIGGKTGVNLDGYKNILGRIQQPEFIYTASETLQTLPQAEFRSGLAEMLKTFIISDAPHYRRAMELIRAGRALDTELIRAAAMIKCGVVERDEFETGERRVLNLGHTVGHAVEWWQSCTPTDRHYSHGEAVAIGTVQAAELSEVLGVCGRGLAEKLAADFVAAGLPVECPVPAAMLEKAIGKDKKAVGDSIYFVLIREIGKVEVRLLPVERVISLLNVCNI